MKNLQHVLIIQTGYERSVVKLNNQYLIMCNKYLMMLDDMGIVTKAIP